MLAFGARDVQGEIGIVKLLKVYDIIVTYASIGRQDSSFE